MQGLTGPQGPTGSTGPAGVSKACWTSGAASSITLENGNFSTVATLTLPTGTYLLLGKVFAASDNVYNSYITCVLWNGTGTYVPQQGSIPIDLNFYTPQASGSGTTTNPGFWRTSLRLQGAVTFAGAGSVTLQCSVGMTSGSGSPNISIPNWQLLATPVGTLMQQ